MGRLGALLEGARRGLPTLGGDLVLQRRTHACQPTTYSAGPSSTALKHGSTHLLFGIQVREALLLRVAGGVALAALGSGLADLVLGTIATSVSLWAPSLATCKASISS